jgi:hypothetical protein
MKKTLIGLFIFMFAVGLFASAVPVFAIGEDVAGEIRRQAETVGSVGFDETGEQGNLLTTRIASIIKIVLGLVGVIVVVIIVYAGFLWMTAGGNSDQVGKAKDWMINAFIGLAITLSAYAITDFVVERFITASQAQ